MNSSENIVMTITPNRVFEVANELCERGEFEKSASELDLTFRKSKLDEFLRRSDMVQLLINGQEEDSNLENYIMAFFFEYERIQVHNRVVKLALKLCESGVFKQVAFDHSLSFSEAKFDEFLRSYTFKEMVQAIREEEDPEIYEGEDGDKTLGDYLISVFFEYRKNQIKNRVINMLDEFRNIGVFQKIALEDNLNFSKSKLDEFLRDNLDDMVNMLLMEKDSLYEGEDGDKLLGGYLISVCVDNTMQE